MDLARSNEANNISERGPHVARIVVGLALARLGERLAGEAPSHHVNQPRILAGVEPGEVSDVPKDRRGLEAAVLDPGKEGLLGVGVKLDIPHTAPSGRREALVGQITEPTA